jgi:hypothetical protein
MQCGDDQVFLFLLYPLNAIWAVRYIPREFRILLGSSPCVWFNGMAMVVEILDMTTVVGFLFSILLPESVA